MKYKVLVSTCLFLSLTGLALYIFYDMESVTTTFASARVFFKYLEGISIVGGLFLVIDLLIGFRNIPGYFKTGTARNLILIAIFLLPLLMMSYTTAIAAGYKSIRGSELKEMIADSIEELIIDVREPELYKKGHIPGAINIEYDDAKKDGLDDLLVDKDSRIVFVCHGGPMGDKLSKKLVERGYTNVHNLAGGMRRWTGIVTTE